ncbi:uncharacterized protein LOC114535295 [Dendronephthya gigantea]|uniref:uncharacterized protein LOC114535295 n=1 Tax=Dendronephthya gigantea TaxID=151771 RepID=UPI00106CFEC4|nr:uncharacterized protein LOC114535295 [Dendronephthya gigantea]
MQRELALSKTEPEVQECSGFKTAKLPKLVISKFDGSYMVWSRFWGQFSEAIDKSTIPPITKFTYLRELLAPKIRRCVEALPFSVEGYNRAKSILTDKYGKESAIVNSYVKEILELAYISNANTRKIAEFSEKLSYCVQALATMQKLEHIRGNVAMTLEKLAGIRGDLVRSDPDWESWDFGQLSEALRQLVRRNPVVSNDKDREVKPLFNAHREDERIKGCVYCGDSEHKATQCTKIVESSERKKILARKGLCFNCATRKHRASECSSKTSCQHCAKRHQSSICEKRLETHGGDGELKIDGASDDGVFPVVVVKVKGVKCRALIDSGAGGSNYASAKLIKTLNTQPSEVKSQRIEMLMATKTTRIEMYDTEISSLDESFKLNVKVSKVDKPELLTVNNPSYDRLKQSYEHLRGVAP